MNLQDLIKTGESDTVEFKEKFDERTIESTVDFGKLIKMGSAEKLGAGRSIRYRLKEMV